MISLYISFKSQLLWPYQLLESKMVIIFLLFFILIGSTPPEVIEFLHKLLKNNDNSYNKWSDGHYLATIIHAVSNINLSDPISR